MVKFLGLPLTTAPTAVRLLDTRVLLSLLPKVSTPLDVLFSRLEVPPISPVVPERFPVSELDVLARLLMVSLRLFETLLSELRTFEIAPPSLPVPIENAELQLDPVFETFVPVLVTVRLILVCASPILVTSLERDPVAVARLPVSP